MGGEAGEGSQRGAWPDSTCTATSPSGKSPLVTAPAAPPGWDGGAFASWAASWCVRARM